MAHAQAGTPSPVPIPKCTLLLSGSWPGAEPADTPLFWQLSAAMFVFSKTGMPETIQPRSHLKQLNLFQIVVSCIYDLRVLRKIPIGSAANL